MLQKYRKMLRVRVFFATCCSLLCGLTCSLAATKETILALYEAPKEAVQEFATLQATAPPGENALLMCAHKIDRTRVDIPPAVASVAKALDGTLASDTESPRDDLWEKVRIQKNRLTSSTLPVLENPETDIPLVHLKGDIDTVHKSVNGSSSGSNLLVKINATRALIGDISSPLNTSVEKAKKNVHASFALKAGLEAVQGDPQAGTHGGIIGSDKKTTDGFDSKKNLMAKMEYLLTRLNEKSTAKNHTTIAAAIDDLGGDLQTYKDLIQAGAADVSAALIAVQGDTEKGQHGGIIGSDNNTTNGMNQHKDIYNKLAVFLRVVHAKQTTPPAYDVNDIVAALFAIQGDVLAGAPAGIIGSNTDFDAKATLFEKMELILQCLNDKSGSNYATIAEAIVDLESDLTVYKNRVNPASATLTGALDTVMSAPADPGPGPGGIIGSDGGGAFDTADNIYDKLVLVRDALITMTGSENDTILEALCEIGAIGCPPAES